MRLCFPNGEHPDVMLEEGELTVGSAAGNRILLADAGLAAHHARLKYDAQRGLTLSVLDAGADVHVNARPVRELALLRLGDVISLGQVQALIKPDRDAAIEVKVPADHRPLTESAQRTAATRVVLRGVSGSYSGRSLPLQDPLRVGSGKDMELQIEDPDLAAHHATLELHGDRVLLRDHGSVDGSVVNGVNVKDAVLYPGDQIAFDGQRFVLEAPGLPPRGSPSLATPGSAQGNTQTLQAVTAEQAARAAAALTSKPAPTPAQEPEASGSRLSYGWLILVAALIGAGLAALVVTAPKL